MALGQWREREIQGDREMTMQSDHIAERVTKALAEAARLQSDGKLLDSALMSVRATEHFDDWRRKRLEEFDGYRATTQATRDRQSLRIQWFEHLLSHGDGKPPIEVSDIQGRIFAGCACQPTTWEEAKAALDLTAEFRAGPRHLLQDKIEACLALTKAADDLLETLDAYQKLIEESETNPAHWNNYSAAFHIGFEQRVDSFNARLRAAHET
jgi:hypothetical protein